MDNLQTDISTPIHEARSPIFPNIKVVKNVVEGKYTDFSIHTYIRKKAENGSYYLQRVEVIRRTGSMELYKWKNNFEDYEEILQSQVISHFNLLCYQVIMFEKLTTEMIRSDITNGYIK